MKSLKKLCISITSILMLLTLCITFVACGGGNKYPEDDDTNWDGKTYVVYVYLDDGVTPVENVSISLCYNTATSNSCLTAAKTNEDGRVSFTFDESIEFVGDPVIHFNKNVITEVYDLPEGYGLPADTTEIAMSGTPAVTYEHAKYATQKVTKFNLTVVAE